MSGSESAHWHAPNTAGEAHHLRTSNFIPDRHHAPEAHRHLISHGIALVVIWAGGPTG
ncbi:hypothetical protein [Streptomyces sp. NBC_00996]|uniref:hypothetical protein n=1 Tax=Streptomyces sp. NBC_00996 TaxID=2903710 RepID=UPI003865EAC4|nr:hypothetical protein OG390_02625 [Streptomyces sp. NBC_00996]